MFLNVNCKVIFTEAYLEPSRISTMELFCENIDGLQPLTSFAKKFLRTDIFDWVLNTPLVHQTNHAKWRLTLIYKNHFLI